MNELIQPYRFATNEGARELSGHKRLLLLMQLALALTLFARGWLTYFWDHPLRGLIWNEEVLEPILQSCFSISWTDFAMSSDRWITPLIKGLGVWLMVMGGLVCFLSRLRVLRWALIPVIGFMVLDVYARFMEHDGRWGMGAEYALQAVMPLLLLLLLSSSTPWRWVRWLALAATSLCFIGHGCYAMGFYPVPWSYQNMCMHLLDLESEGALRFLLVMGYLDFAAVLALIWPRLRKLALCYMVIWGFATALTRVLAHVEASQRWYGLDPWLLETLVRSSHWMVPLVLLSLLRGEDGAPLESIRRLGLAEK